MWVQDNCLLSMIGMSGSPKLEDLPSKRQPIYLKSSLISYAFTSASPSSLFVVSSSSNLVYLLPWEGTPSISLPMLGAQISRPESPHPISNTSLHFSIVEPNFHFGQLPMRGITDFYSRGFLPLPWIQMSGSSLVL